MRLKGKSGITFDTTVEKWLEISSIHVILYAKELEHRNKSGRPKQSAGLWPENCKMSEKQEIVCLLNQPSE